MDCYSVINNNQLLRSLQPEAVDGLASVALTLLHEAGELIFHGGARNQGLYFIVIGRVKIFLASTGGKEVLLQFLEQEEGKGEAVILLKQDEPIYAQTLSKTQSLFIPNDQLQQQMLQYPDIALNLLHAQSRRITEITQTFESLTMQEVPTRLAAFLLNCENDQGFVRLPISKGQLASYLGISPETLSRNFRRLKQSGIIAEEKPYLLILNKERLERLAAGA